MVRVGQDADGSAQVGHATRRGTGVPPVTVMAGTAMPRGVADTYDAHILLKRREDCKRKDEG